MTLWFLLAAVLLAAIFLKGFRRWLSSMSGAVWILVALAAMAIVGVMVGQNLPPDAYTERYGAFLGSAVYKTGLADIFSSWYFLLLAAVLAVSLLACSGGRLRRLATAHGRGRLSRIGSLMLHLALVIILAGGVVTAVFGFRRAAPIYQRAGDEMFVPEGDFTIRVDAAVTEFAESGMVSEYYSDVTVLEDGEEVLSQRIEVNHPLVHNGIGVYQHEMLPAATSVVEVLLGVIVKGDSGDEPLITLAVPFKQRHTVPGTDIDLEVLEFLSDFTYDIETRTVGLVSISHRNPAVKVRIFENDEFVADRWLFADTQVHRDDSDLPCRVFLFDYLPDYANGITRFELTRQPGTPILFVGFAAMSLGLMLTFWVRPERKGEE